MVRRHRARARWPSASPRTSGWHHLDTGLLYRAVARDVQRRGGALDDAGSRRAAARQLDPATLDDPGLRDAGAGEAASIVARIPQVRAALLEFQRAFARQPPGAVLDGRDIGTVVCPDADVKIFVTATPEVRRRAPPSGDARPWRGRHLRGGSGRHPPPRRARCRAARRPPMRPAARRLLAGYQQFGYRSRIRYRRRRDH